MEDKENLKTIQLSSFVHDQKLIDLIYPEGMNIHAHNLMTNNLNQIIQTNPRINRLYTESSNTSRNVESGGKTVISKRQSVCSITLEDNIQGNLDDEIKSINFDLGFGFSSLDKNGEKKDVIQHVYFDAHKSPKSINVNLVDFCNTFSGKVLKQCYSHLLNEDKYKLIDHVSKEMLSFDSPFQNFVVENNIELQTIITNNNPQALYFTDNILFEYVNMEYSDLCDIIKQNNMPDANNLFLCGNITPLFMNEELATPEQKMYSVILIQYAMYLYYNDLYKSLIDINQDKKELLQISYICDKSDKDINPLYSSISLQRELVLGKEPIPNSYKVTTGVNTFVEFLMDQMIKPNLMDKMIKLYINYQKAGLTNFVDDVLKINQLIETRKEENREFESNYQNIQQIFKVDVDNNKFDSKKEQHSERKCTNLNCKCKTPCKNCTCKKEQLEHTQSTSPMYYPVDNLSIEDIFINPVNNTYYLPADVIAEIVNRYHVDDFPEK